ncbi:hypothetical protein D3H45_10565 [Streptococcus pyogenes]|nr:hypothetical protein D3H45_10565 [Streptococcus pyogenes]
MWLSIGSPRNAPYLPYLGNISRTYEAYQKVRDFVTIQDSDGLKQLLHAQLASTDKKEMFTDIFWHI